MSYGSTPNCSTSWPSAVCLCLDIGAVVATFMSPTTVAALRMPTRMSVPTPLYPSSCLDRLARVHSHVYRHACQTRFCFYASHILVFYTQTKIFWDVCADVCGGVPTVVGADTLL